MVEKKHTRRSLLASGATLGLTSIVGQVSSQSKTQVRYAEAGITHELTYDAPDGFYPYNYAKDPLPNLYRFSDRLLYRINGQKDREKFHNLKNRGRIMFWDEAKPGNMSKNIGSGDSGFIGVNLSPRLTPTKTMRVKEIQQAPRIEFNLGSKGVQIESNGKFPSNTVTSGERVFEIDSFSTEAEFTRLKKGEGRETKWVNVDVERKLHVSNPTTLPLVELES